MSESDNEFLGKIDELISLFKKLQEKAQREGIMSEEDPMYENFEMLANNYELMKSSMPPGMMGEMAEPIKEVVSQMVEQLKADLGISEEELNKESAEIKTTNSIPDIEKIDNQLKAGGLSEKEINDLLDKRAELA